VENDKANEKSDIKRRLFAIGIETLEREGFRVERAHGLGKSSVRKIERDGQSLLVSIKTSQDRYIAFAPKADDQGWHTLDDVDVVLAVSVDDSSPPREALVHWLEASDLHARFDRAVEARKKAGYKERHDRGLWLPLYRQDDSVAHVAGGGMGLDHPPIARVPLNGGSPVQSPANSTALRPAAIPLTPSANLGQARRGLTIADAKRGLALSHGVPESAIRIIIEA
jgi:hypothetical protein